MGNLVVSDLVKFLPLPVFGRGSNPERINRYPPQSLKGMCVVFEDSFCRTVRGVCLS